MFYPVCTIIEAGRRIKIFVKGVKMFCNKMDKMLINVLSTGALQSLHPRVGLLRIRNDTRMEIIILNKEHQLNYDNIILHF